MRHDTSINLEAAVPRIRIERRFDAAVERVYEAHVDPELYVQWIGPHGMVTAVSYWDARTGGSWRYVTRSDGFEGAFRGCFHELRPCTLIVGTSTFEGTPDRVSLDRLVLESNGTGGTLLRCTSLFESFEERDALVASGMERGLRQGYERLDALVQQSDRRPTTQSRDP